MATIRHQNIHQSLARSLRVVDFKISAGTSRGENLLVMTIDGLQQPISIECDRQMQFGTEDISAREYFKRVIERGDYIDAIVSERPNPSAPVMLDIFWIQIRYADQPPKGQQFSRKDDGLFALRTKAGEKAERSVTRELRDKYGHVFPQHLTESPGFFEIRYLAKKRRTVDRTCQRCGMRVEVKKRNKDHKFRVSHSELRPFGEENSIEGWHAFVFADMKPRFVHNRVIANALHAGDFSVGHDKYDYWADIAPSSIEVVDPPHCTSIGGDH